jgi:ureidoglycolate lyase
MQQLSDVQKMCIKPLTAAAFAPFGDVLQVSDDNKHFPINDGYTERYHDLANIDVADENGRAIVSFFRSTPLALPIKIKMMERHPLGSQAFMPLSQQPYLVVVAPKGEFNQDKIQVFLAQPTQGVNYHKGTWHHFCLALNQSCDFLVIDRSGKGNNCDVVTLDGARVIEI